MRGPFIFRFGPGSGRLGWLRVLVIVLLVTGISLVVAFVAFSLLVILAPLMLLAAVASFLFPGWRNRSRPNAEPSAGDVIDADFRVVEKGDEKSTTDDRPRLK